MYYQQFMKHKVVLLFALLIFAGWYVYAHHIVGTEEKKAVSGFTQPFEVVHIFMEAVKRGELIVFDYVLTPDMIVPEQVDYSYRLDTPATPVINVYSRLANPLVLPEAGGFDIHGVSAMLDTAGHIIETRAHVQSAADE